MKFVDINSLSQFLKNLKNIFEPKGSLDAAKVYTDDSLANLTADDVGVYVQSEEPVDAVEGDIWVDVDAESHLDPEIVIDSTLTQSGQAADAKVVGDRINTLASANGITFVEPAEDDIPKVFFGRSLPYSKLDTIMSFRYVSKTEDISGYCKIKAQGNTSMNYPKKNQTVKLYKDIECKEKLKINFKNWGEQNKFCFKANWIDITHARNIVSARIWGDIVKSRANYFEMPELLRTSPNQGAIDGFIVKVYAGGVYQGRYTVNIPKDAWMANMDDELDEHCILCGENYTSGCFRAAAVINGNDWTDEVHDVVPDSILTRWNECIDFVMNSTDDEFVTNLSNYFDLQSLIDYYIAGMAFTHWDGFGKNQLYLTYDGIKWYASVYDLDNTFGNHFGNPTTSHDMPREEYEDLNSHDGVYSDRYGNTLYVRLANLFANEIKNRYSELRSGALSIENIINKFERFTDVSSAELVSEDYSETTADGAFTEIAGKTTNNIQQIRDYVVKRLKYVDNILLVPDYGMVYSLASETSFNGTSDYIDTGVALLETNKDYAVFIDFAGAAKQMNTTHYWKTVMSCMREWEDINGTKPGFKISTDNNYQILMRKDSALLPTMNDIPDIANNTTVRQRYIIQKDTSAGTVTFYYVDASGVVQIGVQHALLDADKTYSTPINTLTLGAHKSTANNGTISQFWTGTIYDCKVWERTLSESEINTLMLKHI